MQVVKVAGEVEVMVCVSGSSGSGDGESGIIVGGMVVFEWKRW